MAANKGEIVIQTTTSNDIVISPVSTKAEREEFVDFGLRINADDPNFVPNLRSE